MFGNTRRRAWPSDSQSALLLGGGGRGPARQTGRGVQPALSSEMAESKALVSTGLLRKRHCGIDVLTTRIIDCKSPLKRMAGTSRPWRYPQLMKNVEPGEFSVEVIVGDEHIPGPDIGQ